MVKIIVELFFGFLSPLGFGLVTNVPRRALLPASLTGALSWMAYYLIGTYYNQLIWQNLIATTIIGYLGNVFAHKYKIPVSMIYIPSLVALVPGGLAALGMKSFILSKSHQAGGQLVSVLLIAIVLTTGFIVGESIYEIAHKNRLLHFEKGRIKNGKNN